MDANYQPLLRDQSNTRIPDRLIQTLILISGITGLTIGMVLFYRAVSQTLTTFELADEIEQFVAAQMLNHGHRLYKDIFSHHGPVPYMLSHWYTLFASDWDFSKVRLLQAALALFSAIAVILSPVMKSISSRLAAGAIYLLLVSCFWEQENLYVLIHYKISGFLFVIIVAQCVLPALTSQRPSTYGLFSAGACAALAFFCAYSNAPAIFCFLISIAFCDLAPSRSLSYYAKFVGLGAICATSVVVAWLSRYGDMVGFLVEHLYFNQVIYSKYLDPSELNPIRNFQLAFDARSSIHSIAVVLLVCWLYMLSVIGTRPSTPERWRSRWIALPIITIGVVLANFRAYNSLGDSGFVVINIAFFAISASMTIEEALSTSSKRDALRSFLLICTSIVLSFRISAYAISFFGNPHSDLSRFVGTLKPSREPIYDFVRSITKEDNDLLVLPGNAVIYLKAGRLPASRNLFYWAWQSEYNKNPKYGYAMPICDDLRLHKPAVIWLINLPVSFSFETLDTHDPCVISFIVDGYTPLTFDSPWHIRNDLVASSAASAPSEVPRQLDLLGDANATRNDEIMQRSGILSTFSSIELRLTPLNRQPKTSLRKIGILFTTYGRHTTGTATLYLSGPGRTEFVRSFDLSAISDNKYHYFDIDSGVYSGGRIDAAAGGGISTWEGHFDGSYTCTIYEYADSTHRYTTGCPIM